MRLDTLKLVRYGHFTDHTLNFGALQEGTSDLHIVYGPNEAGKSTLSNAIIDLLYGFGNRSPYAFKHKLPTLEIAATLGLNDESKTLDVKRLRNGLVDSEGNALDEAVIDTQNLSRSDYQSRFWFDDAALHKGGDSILNNKGELGAALFAASTGLNTLTEQLDALMLPTDAFFKPNKRTGLRSKDLKDELKTVQQSIKMQETNLAAWKRLLKQQDHLQKTVVENRAAVERIQTERDRLERYLRALSLFNRWETNQRSLSALSHLPTVPSHWISDFNSLIERYKTHLSTLQELKSELTPIEHALVGVSVAEHWLKHKATIERTKLSAEVLLNTQTTLADLSRRYEERQQLLLGNTAALAGLHPSITEAYSPLSAHQINVIDSTLPTLHYANQQYSTLQSTLVLKQKRIEAITERLVEVATGSPSNESGAATNDVIIAQLSQFIEGAATHDALAAFEHAQHLLKDLESEVVESEVSLKAVPLAEDTDYHSVSVPSTPAIREAVAARKDAHTRINVIQANIKSLQTDVQANDKKLETLGYSTAHDALSLSEAQKRLEEHWANLKITLSKTSNDEKLASRIEQVNDSVVDVRQAIEPALAYARNQGAIDSILSTNANLQGQLQHFRSELNEALEGFEQLEKRYQTQISHLPGLTYDDEAALVNWRDSLERWRKTDAKRLAQSVRVDSVTAQCSSLNDELTNLLNESLSVLPETVAKSVSINRGTKQSTGDAIDSGTVYLALKSNQQQGIRVLTALRERQNIQNTENAKKAEIQKDLELTQQTLSEASVAREAATETILAVAQANWLAELSIEEISTHWALIKERSELLSQLNQMNQEKTHAEHTIDELTKPILELTDELNLNQTGDVMAKLSALLDWHNAQVEQSEKLKQLQTQKTQLTQQTQKQLASLESIKAQLAPMYTTLGCDDVETLRTNFSDIQTRQELEASKTQIESDICELLSVSSFKQAQEELARVGNPVTDKDGGSDVAAVARTDASTDASTDANTPANTDANLRNQLQARLTALNVELSAAEDTHLNNNGDLQQIGREIKAMSLDERTAELRQHEADLVQQLEEGVMQALKYRLGYIAIKRGLQHYRDSNQSELMEAAESAFSALTHNRYTKLFTRPDIKGVEKLYATRENDDSVSADELSTGTRYQLYLALRIAAYHQYRKQRQPLPFIADDIFETFDDSRTRSALKAMVGMGMHGQVIYFTHHAHVVDIAQEVVPGVNTIAL